MVINRVERQLSCGFAGAGDIGFRRKGYALSNRQKGCGSTSRPGLGQRDGEFCLEQLSRKIPIAAFPNTIELHWTLLMNPNSYRRPTFFRRIFASHVLGYAKPRTDAFAKVLADLGVNANEVVFIDGFVINVSGANHLGMRGIVFERASKLREDLSQYLEF